MTKAMALRAVLAFVGGDPYKVGNVEVVRTSGGSCLTVTGRVIATRDPMRGGYTITSAGDKETKVLLNALPGVSLQGEGTKMVLNGKPWDGTETFIRL